jgi:hypothetical protein
MPTPPEDNRLLRPGARSEHSRVPSTRGARVDSGARWLRHGARGLERRARLRAHALAPGRPTIADGRAPRRRATDEPSRTGGVVCPRRGLRNAISMAPSPLVTWKPVRRKIDRQRQKAHPEDEQPPPTPIGRAALVASQRNPARRALRCARRRCRRVVRSAARRIRPPPATRRC